MLDDYLREMLSRGYEHERVRIMALKAGYKEKDVDTAFKRLHGVEPRRDWLIPAVSVGAGLLLGVLVVVLLQLSRAAPVACVDAACIREGIADCRPVYGTLEHTERVSGADVSLTYAVNVTDDCRVHLTLEAADGPRSLRPLLDALTDKEMTCADDAIATSDYASCTGELTKLQRIR